MTYTHPWRHAGPLPDTEATTSVYEVPGFVGDAGEERDFYIDYVSTEDREGARMDVVRFMRRYDKEPMVPMPHLLEMMNPTYDKAIQVAVSRFVVDACGSDEERYLQPGDHSERWLISLVNDTAYKPRTRMITARQACAVLRSDGAMWGDQQRALLQPMQLMDPCDVAAQLGGLSYYSSLYQRDDTQMPPTESPIVTYFSDLIIRSKGDDADAQARHTTRGGTIHIM